MQLRAIRKVMDETVGHLTANARQHERRGELILAEAARDQATRLKLAADALSKEIALHDPIYDPVAEEAARTGIEL